MSSIATVRTLVIANPFWDKTAYVPEEFLKKNNLIKNESNEEPDASRMKELWKQAKNYGNERNGRSGGSGANLMIPLANLGNNQCTILGRIGNDKPAEKIEAHLNKMRVKSKLIKSDSLSTGKVKCFITPDHERSMIATLGATVELNPDDIIEEQLKDYDHWHIEGYAFCNHIVDKCIKVALASDKKASISLNLPTQNIVKKFKSDIEKNIPYMNFIFGNIEEMQALTCFNDIEKIFGYFNVSQTIAVTDGANGCWVKACGDTKAVYFKASKVENVINKTGAGDIWAGIYLALALQGKSVPTCVEMANRGAADWIQQKPGTYTDDKTWEIFRKELAMKI